MSELVEHRGGCHCGKVRFTVIAPSHNLLVYECNCSICTKKQNKHFIVPQSQFTLLEDSQAYLSTYKFNTEQAEHIFCKVCGVQSFYRPRSNPDGYGIMPHCIDSQTILSIKNMFFDGENWEQSYKNDETIKKLSKE